jgi:PAS domain S-box-containing protein
LIGNGFTYWRAIKDLTILVLVISAFLVLFKKLNDVSFRTIAWLFGGVGIVLFAAVFDQCIDLGQIQSVYMLPFAIFTFYIFLIFIPFNMFIRETITLQNIVLQEKRWQNLINQADLIVVDLNRMGVVESINPFFYTLTGFSEEEVIGKDWFEFFIPPKEYYNVQGTFVEVLESEFHPQYLNPILTKNKEEKMIRWFNIRTHDQHGKIKGSLSIGVDVSEETKEKKNLLKKLNEAEKLIKELNKKTNNSE